MLQSFRENTGSVLVKILLGAIIASFALWGVGDVIRNYGRNTPLATVGDYKISPEEFAYSVRQEIKRIQIISKGQMSAEQMRAAGLYDIVLQRMIQEEVMSQEVNRLHLNVPDTLIRQFIHRIKAFEKDGVFNKELFDRVLSMQDMTEGEFIKQTYQSLINVQLMSALTAGTGLPKFYTHMLFKELDTQKTFTVIEVDAEKMKAPQEPTEEVLKNFYQTNQDHYKLPATRSVNLVWVPTEKLVGLIKIDPDQELSYYENNKAELFPDGKVQSFEEAKSQIISILAEKQFPELVSKIKDEVDDSLAAGQKLEEIAKERKWRFQHVEDVPASATDGAGKSVFDRVKDVDLARFIMARAFSLDEMQDSSFTDAPGHGAFIVQVTRVNPPRVPDFEQIKDQVKKDWIKDQKHRQAIDLAHRLSADIKNLEDLKKEARNNHLSIKSSQTFRRSDFINNNDQPAELTDVMLTKAFAQAVGQSTYGISPKGAVIVFLEKVEPYKHRKMDYEKFEKVMEQSYERDLSASFVQALKAAYKVEVDQKVFAQLLHN